MPRPDTPTTKPPKDVQKGLDDMVKRQESKGRPVKVLRTFVKVNRNHPDEVSVKWVAQVQSLATGRKRYWKYYRKWTTS